MAATIGADVGTEALRAIPKPANAYQAKYMPTIIRSPWREVDDAHDAEDDAEAGAHQSVQRTDQYSRSQRLQEVLDLDEHGIHDSVPPPHTPKDARFIVVLSALYRKSANPSYPLRASSSQMLR